MKSARQCFAEYGYAGTSNRHVAEASGLTTGAIYHYFSSKQQLYFAAHEGVQEQIYDRFAEAVEAQTSFLGELGAVLDEAVQLNREDPSLAGFLLSRRTDTQRYPELGAVLGEPNQRTAFFGELLKRAVQRGEVTSKAAPMLMDVIRVVNAGLVFAAADDLELQARSVEAIKLLLAGTLLEIESTSPRDGAV